MTDKTLYIASAGQTHIPRPAKPEPPLAPLELTLSTKADLVI